MENYTLVYRYSTKELLDFEKKIESFLEKNKSNINRELINYTKLIIIYKIILF
jgi:PII-like signaling protein